ncbi:hypothetical protein [Variovorax sp. DXTD-1]|uniref:hypothetical protein n=1 Tax=Variovorax sp. DXTD-1 TaxID=2495592 RepID=UPI000F87A47E|nr:hypothetical protein [Variovorax sp. DXTD-1]RST50435.1 hypothetical protein EJI00_11250 [Variovorax sp. DXTD-1]
MALLSLVGCASDKVAGVQRRTGTAPPADATSACPFTLGAIDDQRDVRSLGQLGRTHIDGEDFNEWFTGGITAIPGYTRDRAAPAIRISVLKAYLQGLATLKSANIVVRVQFARDGAPAATRTYRGFDDSMNWSNSEGEIQTAFDRALNDLTAQIGTDLKKRCKAEGALQPETR